MNGEMIAFDKERVNELKEAYERNLKLGRKEMWFQDMHFDMGYVKYLLQYMEEKGRGKRDE